jgi:hypothetical protein
MIILVIGIITGLLCGLFWQPQFSSNYRPEPPRKQEPKKQPHTWNTTSAPYEAGMLVYQDNGAVVLARDVRKVPIEELQTLAHVVETYASNNSVHLSNAALKQQYQLDVVAQALAYRTEAIKEPPASAGYLLTIELSSASRPLLRALDMAYIDTAFENPVHEQRRRRVHADWQQRRAR